jgi:hypothetical protein
MPKIAFFVADCISSAQSQFESILSQKKTFATAIGGGQW